MLFFAKAGIFIPPKSYWQRRAQGTRLTPIGPGYAPGFFPSTAFRGTIIRCKDGCRMLAGGTERDIRILEGFEAGWSRRSSGLYTVRSAKPCCRVPR
jgi:hypothetical protein